MLVETTCHSAHANNRLSKQPLESTVTVAHQNVLPGCDIQFSIQVEIGDGNPGSCNSVPGSKWLAPIVVSIRERAVAVSKVDFSDTRHQHQIQFAVPIQISRGQTTVARRVRGNRRGRLECPIAISKQERQRISVVCNGARNHEVKLTVAIEV